MNYAFLIRPTVKVDIIYITEYYKKINPELATKFLFRIREAKVYIARSPLAFKLNIKM